MYFLLYAHNQVVSGKEKAAIYDLEHSRITNIPNVLAPVLEAMRTNTIDEIKKQYTPDQPEIIDKYLQFFTNNNLGHYTETPSHFPKMNLEFHYPGIIQNAILETDLEQYNLEKTLWQLDALGCRYVELRISIQEETHIKTLEEVLKSLETSLIVSFSLYINAADFITETQLQSILDSYPKINSIVVCKASKNAVIQSKLHFKKESLQQLEQKSIQSEKHIVNRNYFTESIQYNPSYYKCVSISKNGSIKNTLQDIDIYGNVNVQSLEKVVTEASFQKYWNINADHIEDIKDSPLRYAMCNLYPLQKTETGTYIRLPFHESN